MSVSVPKSQAARAVHGSPETISALLERLDASSAAAQAAQALAGRRVFLCGSGTSFHAALAGEYLLRDAAGLDARAVGAFEFSRYPPPLGPQDALIVLSHSGAKRYSLDALKAARHAGAFTLAVNGIGAPRGEADCQLETVPQEVSQAHTVSYLGAVTVLAALAVVAAQAARRASPAWLGPLTRTPELLKAVLAQDAPLAQAAQAMKGSRLLFAGGGPNFATALEGALKAREMAHLHAEGWELEAAMHGNLAAVEKGDWLVLPAAPGAALARTLELAKAAKEVGAQPFILGEKGPYAGLALEPISEFWSPVPFALALQLLCLHLAAAKGVDPDDNRRGDPTYDRAFRSYQG